MRGPALTQDYKLSPQTEVLDSILKILDKTDILRL